MILIYKIYKYTACFLPNKSYTCTMNREPNIHDTPPPTFEQLDESVANQRLTMHEIAVHVLLGMASELDEPSAAELKEAISHNEDIDELIGILETVQPGFAEAFDGRYASAIQAETRQAQATRREAQIELFRPELGRLVNNLA